MSLFGFADITFNKGPATSGTKGPLRALEGTQFARNALRYPIDIGNYDKGHYIVFYVRQQKNTQFKRGTVSDSEINSYGGARFQNIPGISAGVSTISDLSSSLSNALNSGLSKLNSVTGGALSGVTGILGQAVTNTSESINSIFGQSSSLSGSGESTSEIIDNSIKSISNDSFLQTTELTTDAIALYMPDTMTYNYQQSYDQMNLGGESMGQALAAGSSALEAFREAGGGSEGAVDAIKKAAQGAGLAAAQRGFQTAGSLTGSSQTSQVAFTRLLGVVQNPMLELIYRSPSFRTFQYDFMFYPRDEREALEVQKIIERFRFHQAPEFSESTKGFLIPPSQFDIRFYYGGFQNPNIPQVGTCVLTSIDVNYAPNGWSAYEVPGENSPAIGRTGMPTAIQMTMQFQETVYLTKRDFNDEIGQVRSSPMSSGVL